MTGWALLIIVIVQGVFSSSTTSNVIYFADEDACKTSAATLVRALRDDPTKPDFQISCLPRKTQ